MGLHDVLHDREPQARAAELPAAGLVDAVEPLEEPWQVLGLDATALVADGDDHGWAAAGRFGLDADRDPDRAARIAVFDGIVNEVDQCLLQERCVDLSLDVRIAGDIELNGTVAGPGQAVDRHG